MAVRKLYVRPTFVVHIPCTGPLQPSLSGEHTFYENLDYKNKFRDYME